MRAFGIGRHRSVDDTPFGGGAGMVLRPDVVDAACDAALASAPGPPLGGAHPARQAAHPVRRARPRRGPRRRAALRALRGRGPARDRGAGDARDLGRRLRPLGRRDGSHGPARRLRAPPARRHGRRRERRRRKASPPTACWNTRTTPARPSGTAAACRRCCSPATTPTSRLASRRGRARHPRAPSRPVEPPRRRGDHPDHAAEGEGRAPPPLAARPDAA